MRQVLHDAINENLSLQKVDFIFLEGHVADLSPENVPEKVLSAFLVLKTCESTLFS